MNVSRRETTRADWGPKRGGYRQDNCGLGPLRLARDPYRGAVRFYRSRGLPRFLSCPPQPSHRFVSGPSTRRPQSKHSYSSASGSVSNGRIYHSRLRVDLLLSLIFLVENKHKKRNRWTIVWFSVHSVFVLFVHVQRITQSGGHITTAWDRFRRRGLQDGNPVQRVRTDLLRLTVPLRQKSLEERLEERVSFLS